MLSIREPILVPLRGCKFITGDPAQSGWSYCGEVLLEANSSWCEEHHAVVYGRPRAKPKAPPAATVKLAHAAVSLEDPLLLS